MKTTKGERVYVNTEGRLFLKEGQYGQDKYGTWYARPPDHHTGNLSNHEVLENQDGTITVSPSILINDGRKEWHGYLRNGIWEEL